MPAYRFVIVDDHPCSAARCARRWALPSDAEIQEAGSLDESTQLLAGTRDRS